MNVLENVLLPLVEIKMPRPEKIKRGQELLGLMGLARKEKAAINNLSMGERQRVAISRAMAANPSMIFADEPTGNLDSKTSVEIMAVFQQLNRQGITIIMVTHEQDVAAYAGRHLVFKDGLILVDTVNSTPSVAAPVRDATS